MKVLYTAWKKKTRNFREISGIAEARQRSENQCGSGDAASPQRERGTVCHFGIFGAKFSAFHDISVPKNHGVLSTSLVRNCEMLINDLTLIKVSLCATENLSWQHWQRRRSVSRWRRGAGRWCAQGCAE